MRKIIIHEWDGIQLSMPERVLPLFHTVHNYKSFPDNYCGAGKGLGEKLVPDYIFGPSRYLDFMGFNFSIKITPACFIHDEDWSDADPTWTDFYASNFRLSSNIASIIQSKAANGFIKARALYRPVTYQNAVDIAGKGVFWSIKAGQGYKIPHDAVRHVDTDLKYAVMMKIKKKDLL